MRDLYLKIKWFIQRGRRGFADCDVWDFDIYLSRIIKDGLKELKQWKDGYPCDVSPKEWDKILSDIIYTFETEEKCLEDFKHDSERNDDKRKNRGWVLFKKYFHNLWD